MFLVNFTYRVLSNSTQMAARIIISNNSDQRSKLQQRSISLASTSKYPHKLADFQPIRPSQTRPVYTTLYCIILSEYREGLRLTYVVCNFASRCSNWNSLGKLFWLVSILVRPAHPAGDWLIDAAAELMHQTGVTRPTSASPIQWSNTLL